MKLIVLVAWWILVNAHIDYQDGALPRALGPYPSEELCRLAGRSVMPSEERFMTADEIAERDRQAKDEREKDERALAAARKDRKGRKHPNDDGAVGVVMFNHSPSVVREWFTPLSGCTEVQ